MLENEQVVVNQRHAGAAAETEARHPVTPPEPPRHFGRTRLVALVFVIAIPPVLCWVLDKLQ